MRRVRGGSRSGGDPVEWGWIQGGKSLGRLLGGGGLSRENSQ